jgi:hypothetical protein
LLVLLATLSPAVAARVVILLAASASFLANLLFSRAPFSTVLRAVDRVVFGPRLPLGNTVSMIGEARLDAASTIAPVTFDAWLMTSPATCVVWSRASRPASIAVFIVLLSRFLAILTLLLF